jgi:hypothetical protein
VSKKRFFFFLTFFFSRVGLVFEEKTLSGCLYYLVFEYITVVNAIFLELRLKKREKEKRKQKKRKSFLNLRKDAP